MERGLFRRAALERLSTPDRLDELIEVTTPHGWLALAAIIALLAAVAAWAVYGSVPTVVHAEGMLVREATTGSVVDSLERTGGPLEAVVYVSPWEAATVRPGMEVQIAPASVKREEYGLLLGQVSTVASPGERTEVRVQLTASATTFSGYRWTSASGPAFTLANGTPCSAEIVTEQEAPLHLVFARLTR